MAQDNYINTTHLEGDLEVVEDFRKHGRLLPDFFPVVTYDMVQCGYPRPDHGEMVPRVYGGTDKDGKMFSPDGMWCKVEDVKKLLQSK
jgi:hypothetical protein